jgi:hypothetical protein
MFKDARSKRFAGQSARKCHPLPIWQSAGGKLSVVSGSICGWKGTKQASMQICQNALSLAQEREFMRRNRFQKGSVRPRKHGPHKVWVAQWREQGTNRTKVLGRCSQVSKGQAHAMLAQILQPLNESVEFQQAPIFTFKQCVGDVFLPAYRQKSKESTRSTSEPDIVRYLIPAFGDKLMSTITRQHMQKFLAQTAGSLSSSVVGHLRWHLNAIFKMAVSDGVVDFNPSEALFTPACKTTPDKRTMSKDEVLTLLSVLDLRERLVVRMGVFEACVRVKSMRYKLARFKNVRCALTSDCTAVATSTRPKAAKVRIHPERWRWRRERFWILTFGRPSLANFQLQPTCLLQRRGRLPFGRTITGSGASGHVWGSSDWVG